MTRRLVLIVASVMAAVVVALLVATEDEQPLELRQFGGQDFEMPTYVTGAPADPDQVFVVEGPGTIRLVKGGVAEDAPFLDISRDVCFIDEGCAEESGLFSMALPPDYERSGRFYVFYTRASKPQHDLVIEEFRRSQANPDVADLASRREVMVIPHPTGDYHNGGQLQFGPDGLLYVGVGDADLPTNGQKITTRLGKLLRIDPLDPPGPAGYSIPRDNPFFDGEGGNADEIYSTGLRNPWRFSFDRLTGALAVGDVGQSLREEIDFVAKGRGRGANFGWDCFEGSVRYPVSQTPSCKGRDDELTPPAIEYTNPGGPDYPSSAVAGGVFVRDGALPSLRGRYLYADTYNVLGDELRSARLVTVELAQGGSKILGWLPGADAVVDDSSTGLAAENVVSFGEDACGHVYVASYQGPVYRIEPSSGPFPCEPSGGAPAG